MEFDPSMFDELFARCCQAPHDDAPKTQGNSRAFRKSRTTGGSVNGVPFDMLQTMDPAMPLRFEMDKGWACNEFVACEAQDIPKYFEKDYITPAVFNAHMQLSRYYEPGMWEDAVEEAELWLKGPYRAYYRALYGVANTLRKMQRYSESLEIYDQLMKLDSNWYWYSSYVNIHATYPLALLGAKGPQATREWFNTQEKVSDHFTYISSSLYHAATYALVELEVSAATGHGVGKEGAAVTADDNWAADGLDVAQYGNSTSLWAAAKSGLSLVVLCMHYPDAVDMLLGDKASPKAMVSMTTGGPAGLDVSAAYGYTAGHHWRSRPVALERLRRYRNTMELRCLLADLMDRLPVSISDIKHYITAPGGLHKESLGREQGQPYFVRNLVEWLCCVSDGKEFSKDQLQVLKWLLDAGCPICNTHKDRPCDTVLHMACYQGYGPECVKLLLAAGGDVFSLNDGDITPIEMTANQGNWRELQALFEMKPELKTSDISRMKLWSPNFRSLTRQVKIPEALLLLMYDSSCLPCLAGGERCMRCSNHTPHSKYADFFKYAEVVINECGLTQLSKHVVSQMDTAVSRIGWLSVWGRLHKHIMDCIAAAAAKASTESMSAAAGAAAAGRCGGSNVPTGPSLPLRQTVTAAAAVSDSNTNATSKPHSDTDINKWERQKQGERFCWCCAATAASGTELKRCGGCKKAKYCSAACQKKNWKQHTVQCKIWRGDKENAG